MSKPDKRSEILSAALDLIAEHGFHGAPMSMIAGRAKVAAGTIYCYFESKDTLIMELYREIEGRILAVIVEECEDERPLRERFVNLFTKLLGYFTEHSLEFRFVEQFHNSPYGAEHRRDKILGKPGDHDVFRQLFEQGVSQGIIKDLPLVILFSLAFGPLLAVVRDHVLGFIQLENGLIETIAASCWDAIKRQ
ncbi:MAG: TetR/AcrR family transcriptional regulator [Desulfuromonadales bacterium]|nr:TetR/AcrR family transcriptional regulator [Desulfuromonadales bacterium]